MLNLKYLGLAAVLGSVVACGSEPKPPPAAPSGNTEAPIATPAPAPSPKPEDDPAKSQINISDEIRKACGISDAEAYFDFDSANVQPAARATLGKLAKCFTDGPLKGRKMNLVGHADPRGPADYNRILGQKRADSVQSYLLGKGMVKPKCDSTTRGADDATGNDEVSWAKDRRVDVMLAE